MTANEAVLKATSLLGYSAANSENSIPSGIMNRAAAIVNIIYSELYELSCGDADRGAENFRAVTLLSDELSLPENVLETLVCGVAALIAQSCADQDNQVLWAETYNKRRGRLCHTYQRVNSLFKENEE